MAVCDELQITMRPLAPLERRSWKDLLRRVTILLESYEAKALVIGLPSRLDGTEGAAAEAARSIAAKFQRSLSVPVYLQNESLTTFAAESHLKSVGRSEGEIERQIDSEAAAIILRDFINRQQP